jgi:hypothetical protein
MRHLCWYTNAVVRKYAKSQNDIDLIGTNFWVRRPEGTPKSESGLACLSGSGLQASDPNLCILGKNPMTHDGELGRPVFLDGVPVYVEMVEIQGDFIFM